VPAFRTQGYLPRFSYNSHMTAIFVLRHPQTTWNRAERYQGRLDAPLSAEGRRQSSLAARAFQGASLDCVVTSPLSRALNLGEAIAATTGASLRTDSRLVEMGQGSWEGLHVSEIRARFPATFAKWHTRPDQVRFPGGEALIDVEQRTIGAFNDIYRAFPRGSVAVVSHSVIVQIIALRSLHMDLRYLHSMKISNASVTTLCGPDAPGALLSLNVTQSLYGSPVKSAQAEACADAPARRHTT
jgi:broad specificity phosphatase PhoE